MPARNVYSISFPDDLDNVISGLMREFRLSRARAVQYLCRKGLESDPVGASYLKQRLADNERERSALTEQLERLVRAQEEQPKPVDGPVAGGVAPTPKPAYADNRLSKTPEEHWRTKVGYVLNPPTHLEKAIIERVTKTVAEEAEAHPEWVDRLEVAEQTALEAKMRICEAA
jgi:hypothetical protein